MSYHLPLVHILVIKRSFIAETNNYNKNVKYQTHLEIKKKRKNKLLKCMKAKYKCVESGINMKCNSSNRLSLLYIIL